MAPVDPILWLTYLADEDRSGKVTITTTNLTPADLERIDNRLSEQQRGTLVEALERAAIVLSGRQETAVGVQLLERMLDDVAKTHAASSAVDELRRRLGLYRERTPAAPRDPTLLSH